MKKKKIILIISIIVVLLLTIGVSLAAYTYTRVGSNQELVLGDIYMHYNEGNGITLIDAYPSENYDSTKYFEFTISGKNTYTEKDIWYDISLIYGDNHETRNTRIRDDLLRFSLVEIKDEVETIVVDNQSYSSLDNKRIYVNTIEKNTTSEVNITYRLYMWIDYNTVIGNVNQDYTMEEWEDVYASIKVKVTGDFNEKEMLTDASCFTTSTKTHYIVNDIMKSQTYTSGGTNELSQCVDYFSDAYYFDEVEDAESFCKGEGTYSGLTFQNKINAGGFGEYTLFEFFNKNILLEQGEFISITGYNSSCGSDVVIPKEIDGKEVSEIGYNAFYNKQLTSVVIPNSVVVIDYKAFNDNQLTSVEFEENSKLKSIVTGAFSENYISEVYVPESVSYFNCDAFDDDVIINKSDSLVCTEGK